MFRRQWDSHRVRLSSPELHLAGVFADQFRRGASSGHLVFELLKSFPRPALAIVDEPDRGISRPRPDDNGRAILHNVFVDKVFVMSLAADRPFETDRGNGAGTELLITTGLHHFGGDRLFLNRGLFRLAMVSRLIEDARNGREHVIGRVAFTQNFGLQILRDTQQAGTPLLTPSSIPRPRMRLSFVDLR